jgi:hypothetical protein
VATDAVGATALTRQAKVAPGVPDLLRRDFTAEAPDNGWVTESATSPPPRGGYTWL